MCLKVKIAYTVVSTVTSNANIEDNKILKGFSKQRTLLNFQYSVVVILETDILMRRERKRIRMILAA